MNTTNFVIFFIFALVISLGLIIIAIKNKDEFTAAFAIFCAIVGIFVTVRYAIDFKAPKDEITEKAPETSIALCGITEED